METTQEKIDRLEADKQRFIDDGEPQLAQYVQNRIDQLSGEQPPKKKRRSGDVAALGMTKEEEYYRSATLSHGGQGSYLAGGRARSDVQSTHQVNRSRAKGAAAASWREYQNWKRTGVEVNPKNGAIVSITLQPRLRGPGLRRLLLLLSRPSVPHG